MRLVCALSLAAALAAALSGTAAPDSFRFAILGDRTGEARAGVYEQVWREAAAEDLAFVIGVGDTIQGLNDATAENEWLEVERMLAAYRRIPLYLAPGNHDIWSEKSERWFRQYARRAPHYSFDYAGAHFTILDNSRSDQLAAEEIAFLESDLRAHAGQPLKFVVSHRPSWLLDAALGNTRFPLHQLALKYGVRYVVAGHVHQRMHVELEGVAYLSVASSGGHLRLTGKYEDGWFFGWTRVAVQGADVVMQVRELKAPHGQGRVTSPKDWGRAGLLRPIAP
jgi:3',5'-cyclic-AMP phosphodiesterase